MSAQPRDNYRHIKRYGISTAKDDNSVAKTIRTDIYDLLPETPKEVKRYRNSLHQPGAASRHFGYTEDQYPDDRFGKRTDRSERARDVVNPDESNPLLDYLRSKNESIYRSAKKEPLGKSSSVGYQLPQYTKDTSYRFGVKSNMDITAKELLFPKDVHHNDEEARQLYIKTHKGYDAGEQMKRNYDWENTKIPDPAEHRFGLFRAEEQNGAAKCIHPNQLDKKSNLNNEPAIVSELQSRFIETSRDPVGRIKKSGDAEFDENYVFGKKTPGDEWGAHECIKGDYSAEEQVPDPDLGQSLHYGYRNRISNDRVFGVPTIRYDIKAPKVKSIADPQNYGKDPAANASLYPNRFIYKGLNEDDFDSVIDKELMKDLILASGALDDDSDFDHIYNLALEDFASEIEFVKQRDRLDPDFEGITLDMFRRAMRKYASID